MTRTGKLFAAVLLLGIVPAIQVHAQPADQAYLEAAQKIYKDAPGDCGACHGWNGTGRAHDHIYAADFDAGGPSLMNSKMTREEMIEIISCGKINAGANNVMPQYRQDAWTPAYPCWGKVAADIPADQRPLRTSVNLTPPQIEAVVAYIQEVYQGKFMSWEWCLKYFDDAQRICEVWRDYGAQ
jgi:hypothetical protein